MMKLTKSNLAKLVKTKCHLDLDDNQTVRLMFRSFTRDNARFQLTAKGSKLLKQAGIKSYKIKLQKKLTMRAIINLDRSCTCPYYISPRTMYAILFAEKPAMILHLLDGDVENFNL